MVVMIPSQIHWWNLLMSAVIFIATDLGFVPGMGHVAHDAALHEVSDNIQRF